MSVESFTKIVLLIQSAAISDNIGKQVRNYVKSPPSRHNQILLMGIDILKFDKMVENGEDREAGRGMDAEFGTKVATMGCDCVDGQA